MLPTVGFSSNSPTCASEMLPAKRTILGNPLPSRTLFHDADPQLPRLQLVLKCEDCVLNSTGTVTGRINQRYLSTHGVKVSSSAATFTVTKGAGTASIPHFHAETMMPARPGSKLVVRCKRTSVQLLSFRAECYRLPEVGLCSSVTLGKGPDTRNYFPSLYLWFEKTSLSRIARAANSRSPKHTCCCT